MPGTERATQNYPSHPTLEQVILNRYADRRLIIKEGSVKDHKNIKAKKTPANILRDLHALGA